MNDDEFENETGNEDEPDGMEILRWQRTIMRDPSISQSSKLASIIIGSEGRRMGDVILKPARMARQAGITRERMDAVIESLVRLGYLRKREKAGKSSDWIYDFTIPARGTR